MITTVAFPTVTIVQEKKP